MKVGVCLNFRGMDGFEEKVKEVREQGFDNCQLISWNTALWTDENAEVLNRLFEENEVKISAFWCGWSGPKVWNLYEGPTTLGLVPAEYREERVKDLCNGADFAKKLGVQNVVTHMGFIPEDPNDEKFIPFCDAVREVANHLESNGQNLLFETGQETPVAMLRCFEVVGTSNLGVNLDTANLIMYGKANPVDSLDVFGTKVMNVHAKDGIYPVNGHELGKEVKIGTGKVDFEKVLETLHKLGYDSYITIEREISGEEQIRDIKDAKAYLEEIIAKIEG